LIDRFKKQFKLQKVFQRSEYRLLDLGAGKPTKKPAPKETGFNFFNPIAIPSPLWEGR